MKWVECRRVAITWLNVTDDIRARTKEARVTELALSMRQATGGEPGNMPWATERDGRYDIVAGRDRVAAVLRLHSDDIWVRVGEFSARELLLAEVHENLHRRPEDRTVLLARLVGATEKDIITRQASANGDTRQASGKPGRPTTTRGEARREAARDAGLSVNAVERADQRAKSREVAGRHATQGDPAGGSSSPLETPSPPPIEMWGVPIGELFTADVRAIQAAIDAGNNHLQAAQAAFTKLPDRPEYAELRDRWRQELHRVAANLRQDRPAALCPWCKHGFPGMPMTFVNGMPKTFGDDCLGCRGYGWVTAEKLANAPKQLLRADVYAVDGEFLPRAAAAAKFDQIATGVSRHATPHPVAARAPVVAAARPSKARISAPIRKRALVELADGTRVDVADIPDAELPSAKNPRPPSKLLRGADGEVVDPYAGEAPPFDESDLPPADEDWK